jgi:hypothetical protein
MILLALYVALFRRSTTWCPNGPPSWAPLFESHCGLLGVGAVAEGVLGFGQACAGLGVAAGGVVVVCVAFAGVAVFFSCLVVGSVLVGVGAVVGLGHLAMFMCASPGCGCPHCALLRSLFGLDVVGDVGLVTAGLVCA